MQRQRKRREGEKKATQAEIARGRETDRQTDRDRQTYRHGEIQSEAGEPIWTKRQTGKEMEGRTDTLTDRQNVR